MTTWTIIEHPTPDRMTVRYTADDGVRSILMVDMYWDQVTAIDVWLGRVNPFPKPVGLDNPDPRELPPPMVGMTGVSPEPERTPPETEEELEARKKRATVPPSDPLTAV